MATHTLRAKRRRSALRTVAFLSPWLIGFGVFFAYPLASTVYFSLMKYDGFGTPVFRGLDNWLYVFQDYPLFWPALRNTLWLVLVMVTCRVVFGLGVGLLITRIRTGTGVFRTLFYLPSVTSGVATVVLWVWILHPTGLLNQGLATLGITGPNWFGSTTWALPGLILMSFWNIGSTMVIYLAGLQGVPQQLYDAAEIDGANSWQRVRYVTIPMMTPSIFLTLILGVIGSFQVFTAALVATEGGPGYATTFVLLHLYFNAFRYFRMGYASAIGWVLFVIIMFFTILQFWLASRWVYYEGEAQ